MAACLFLLATTTLAACTMSAGASDTAPVTLTMWTHGGTDAERQSLLAQIEDWNTSQSDSVVDVVEVSEGDYGHTVQTAITDRSLPDIVEVDGPLVSSYAYQGALLPLEDRVAESVLDSLLPSLVVQGTYADHLYAVGAFESGLALYADRSRLVQAGVRIPTGVDDAWSAAELIDVLAALAADDEDRKVLDLKLNYGVGEWLTYGFSPLLWSAGADLVDRETGMASGTLDSPAAVDALRTLQSWQSYVDPNTEDTAFVEREVALSWVGHWAYADYSAALGEDLLLLPLPDMGRGTRSSQGSWAWALSSGGAHPDEAARVLQHLVSDASIGATTTANGAIPGTWTALQQDGRYSTGKPLAPFADALSLTCGDSADAEGCVSVSRPRTPGYPTLSYAFARAVDAVLHGEDPQQALTRAATAVDLDVRANDGYVTDRD